MGGFMAFLGTLRDVAWVYLCLMFLVASWLYFADRRRKSSTARDSAENRERGAA